MIQADALYLGVKLNWASKQQHWNIRSVWAVAFNTTRYFFVSNTTVKANTCISPTRISTTNIWIVHESGLVSHYCHSIIDNMHYSESKHCWKHISWNYYCDEQYEIKIGDSDYVLTICAVNFLVIQLLNKCNVRYNTKQSCLKRQKSILCTP